MGAAAAVPADVLDGKKGKNVLGFDFDIPDELSQILAAEMAKQKSDGLP